MPWYLSARAPLMVRTEPLAWWADHHQGRRWSLQGLTHWPPTSHLLQPDTLPAAQQGQNANSEAQGPRHRCRAADVSTAHPAPGSCLPAHLVQGAGPHLHGGHGQHSHDLEMAQWASSGGRWGGPCAHEAHRPSQRRQGRPHGSGLTSAEELPHQFCAPREPDPHTRSSSAGYHEQQLLQ